MSENGHETPAAGREAEQQATDLREVRAALQQRIGLLVSAMIGTKRYGAATVSQLDALAIQPLLHDRVMFFGGKNDAAPSGIAIWASVDAAVAQRLSADEGGRPPLLAPGEWTSGDERWLLDIIAPSPADGSATFLAFSRAMEGASFRMHPSVPRSLDPSLIESLRRGVEKLRTVDQDVRESAGAANAADDL